jgi:hypothetical protein
MPLKFNIYIYIYIYIVIIIIMLIKENSRKLLLYTFFLGVLNKSWYFTSRNLNLAAKSKKKKQTNLSH